MPIYICCSRNIQVLSSSLIKAGTLKMCDLFIKFISGWLWHPCYNIDPRSSQEYDGEVHEGRCEAMSIPDQVSGKCFECHMLLVLQTSSQTCKGIQDRVVQQKHIKLVVQLGRSEHKSFL
jgi:hypothetical protein